MLTKEVAGSPIDQAVFTLFDNLMDTINGWKENPVSNSFSNAIQNKLGGFEMDVPIKNEVGEIVIQRMNIWDVVVGDKGNTLQQFLLHRITV